jgi:uroporphyrinogen decarboxylase
MKETGVYLLNKASGIERRLNEPRVSGQEHFGKYDANMEPLEAPEEIKDKIQKTVGNITGEVLPGAGRLAKLILQDAGLGRAAFCHSTSPLRWVYELWGYEGMMIMIATNPEIVKYACKQYLEISVNIAKRAVLLGAGIIWIEDCFTDAISPESYRSLCVPYAQQLVDEIRRLGLKSVYYYTGNPYGKIKDILSIGADAFSFEESKKNFSIDIEDLASEVNGRCTLLGNLDVIGILQNGSNEELEVEIKRQIKAGRNNKNRFIMSIGSPVTPQTPIERVDLYIELARKYGAVK